MTIMRRLLAATGALLALALAAPGSSAAGLAPDAFYSKTAPSVWIVRTFDADGLILATGSAVVIAPEALLTNCHVLAKASRVIVRKENASYQAKLVHADVERDMCQLAAANLPSPAVALGDSDRLGVGQRVYALGNPQGLELTLSDGLISALRKNDDGKLIVIQTTAPISHGSSGGGLFDENGKLIGITTLQARDGQNLNFAIPINWLRDLPERSAAALKKRKEELAARAGSAPAAGGAKFTPSGYADIGDLAKLPLQNPKARFVYSEFLTKPFPRAFAVGERGAWWYAWGTRPKDPNLPSDPSVRALQQCEKQRQQRCVLYAVDDVVVYRPQGR
jgi:serine protease Do